MSQMVTRKRTGGDEKEKRQTDSPVKDMKKKMAANAEKEKNATEKPAETTAEKPAEKPTEKPVDKIEKPKPAEKAPEKPTEKKHDKPAEKKSDAQTEKKKEDGKAESSGKTDKPEKKPDARDTHKPKQNGSSNGVNGTVSGVGDSDSDELVIDDNDDVDENDELFPELAYDESDAEWEPDAPGRSLTRRSQVKVTRTPETPRPASDKQVDGEQSKDSKVLKLTQESGKTSDSPKPDTKKPESKPDAKKPEVAKDAKQDSPKPDAKKSQEAKEPPKEAKKDEKESSRKVEKEKEKEKSDKVEVEVVVDIESGNEPEESRKPDTNYSKSRVKVSPYRRSTRLADLTASSMAANYTGNNTTMEMDITESSSMMEEALDDSSYLSGLRSIRGRRSYKPLQEMSLRNVSLNRSARSVTSTVTVPESRPTGTVVGRKRKPDADEASPASEAEELPAAGKRQRLIERLARPFRRTALLPARRNAEIVGINTDLPLTAPVAPDPEALKREAPPAAAPAPAPAPLAEDSKRCVIV